jgi:hypothetical protein
VRPCPIVACRALHTCLPNAHVVRSTPRSRAVASGAFEPRDESGARTNGGDARAFFMTADLALIAAFVLELLERSLTAAPCRAGVWPTEGPAYTPRGAHVASTRGCIRMNGVGLVTI